MRSSSGEPVAVVAAAPISVPAAAAVAMVAVLTWPLASVTAPAVIALDASIIVDDPVDRPNRHPGADAPSCAARTRSPPSVDALAEHLADLLPLGISVVAWVEVVDNQRRGGGGPRHAIGRFPDGADRVVDGRRPPADGLPIRGGRGWRRTHVSRALVQ